MSINSLVGRLGRFSLRRRISVTRDFMLRAWRIWSVIAFGSTEALPAQTVRAFHRAEATFNVELTYASAIRELSNGDILLLDSGDRRLYYIDARESKVRSVGREGPGPGEFVLPTMLFALGGDTTVIVDAGAERLSLILPSGQIGKVQDLQSWIGSDLRVAPPRFIDRNGSFYFTAPARRGGVPGETDTVPLMRQQRGSKTTDTLAFVAQPKRMGGRPMAYPAGDAWVATGSGKIIIARPSPLRIAFIDGRDTIERTVARIPVPTTALHRRIWLAWKNAQPVMMMGVSPTGQRTAFTASAARSQLTEGAFQWPEVVPPFVGEPSVFAAPDGTAWLRLAAASESAGTE